MPGNLIARNPCTHDGHVTTCPDCRNVPPVVTTTAELEWMRKHLPRHHLVMTGAVRTGEAVVTREVPGCKAF